MVFLVFFDLKARKEEIWLKHQFPDYENYQSQVKKLIPWIY
jgi:protein-S-isoprenylcysteine O-methyltransferase Ste14